MSYPPGVPMTITRPLYAASTGYSYFFIAIFVNSCLKSIRSFLFFYDTFFFLKMLINEV